jgi:predicted DNA-binding protein YlxM (UPF0122 family)
MNVCNYTPRIQPDETLYSYLARCHFLWGGANHRTTSLEWFNRQGVHLNQCLPTEVPNISKFADYPIEYLLRHHTFLPLFDAMSASSSDLKQSMLSCGGQTLANASGISQLGKAELTNSKICPVCFNADIERIGVGYWHLMHQFLGVRSCYCHGCKLIENVINPRQYTLPELPADYEICTSPVIQYDFAKFVADTAERAANNPDNEISLHNILNEKSIFRRGSHIEMLGLKFFINAIEAGLDLPPLVNESCLRSVLTKEHHNAHPLKKLVLQFALNFVPGSKNLTDRHSGNNEQKTSLQAQQIQHALKLLNEYSHSMRAISRRTGLSTYSIKSLAKRNGISVGQRRKTITPDMERRIIALAIDNVHRNEIATQFEISTGAVEQIIESVAGLSLWRNYLRMFERRNLMRIELRDAIKTHPECSRGDIKMKACRSYMFLYKFDRAWLYDVLPEKTPRVYYGGGLWAKRDEKLVCALQELLLKYQKDSNPPSLHIIDKYFGNHGWFTRSLAKLPKCQAVIQNLKNTV